MTYYSNILTTGDMRSWYEIKKKLIRDSFRDVFYKYVRPGRGTDLEWSFHFGKDKRKHVLRRLKMLLSWVSDEDLNRLTDKEIFSRVVRQYKYYVKYYKGKYLDEFIMYKYGEIDLG